MSLVLAILALGMLVIVHEGGHYLVAKWCKMRVERFSLGFGPAIVKWRRKGTQFQIAPFPLGGFVQITGMNPHEEFDEKDPSVYPNRPTYQRFLTILAGPLTNVLFSSVLVFVILAFAGAETGRLQVAGTRAGDPADGHLQRGDVILRVSGHEISEKEVPLQQRIQESLGNPIDVTVLRHGQEVTLTMTPKKAETGKYLIGVELGHERAPVGMGTAFVESVKYPVIQSKFILGGLAEILTGKAKPEATGPVGITATIQTSIRAGWISALELLALLNVYLGLFNLLPLPALDGGRLVFLGYELATRRRPNPKVEAAVHMAGFVVLFLLLILVTFSDIKKLFT